MRADRIRRERGSAVAGLAVLLAVVSVALSIVGLGSALAARQRVVDAADAAALAAADTASGAVAGVPCESASAVARANGAAVDECAVAGVVATVRVSSTVLGVPVRATARAGPPP